MAEITVTSPTGQALKVPRRSFLNEINPGFLAMIAVGLVLILSTLIAPSGAIPFVGGLGVLLVLGGWILGKHLSAWSWVMSFLVLVVPGINGPLAVLTCLMLAAIGMFVAGGHNLMEVKAPEDHVGVPKLQVQRLNRPQQPVQIGVDMAGNPIYASPQAQPFTYVQQPGKTNTLALLAMIFGILGGLAAIPLGHVALSQIRRTGESGRGMAIAGLILGYASVAIVACLYIIYLLLVVNSF